MTRCHFRSTLTFPKSDLKYAVIPDLCLVIAYFCDVTLACSRFDLYPKGEPSMQLHSASEMTPPEGVILHSRSASITRKNVLLVEDDVPLARFLAREFKQSHCSVTVMHDAETALRDIAQADYDLMIMDLNLPSMDGLELLERVRRSAASPPDSCSDRTQSCRGPCAGVAKGSRRLSC